ncbi:glycosyltransferase family 2 protein [Planktothrix pseudagardhii]|uniref:Glycosyltransferase MT0564 n=1 Tax=Planktothrix pseudagardhii TaxID=132604 RepID=A0A9W4CQV2_9CYAN|nr:glycosyltransferase family 2 protein [Planktothrix pseudagardhii]CAD5978387.1 putative glycosyltransferase MT0564 [Planktothrix pseudagardhii]
MYQVVDGELTTAIQTTLTEGKGLSLVIPAFNEEAAIATVVTGMINLLKPTGGEFEVLVVDDCSTDSTAEKAKQAGAKVIRQGRNRGYGAALKTGIRKAKYGLIAIADADGQHDAEQLASLLMALGDADVAIGTRYNSPVPILRKPGKLILKWVANWVTGWKIPDLNSGLRVMRREAIFDCMHLAPDGFSFSTTTTIALINNGWLIQWVPIIINQRVGRPSSVKIVRDGLNTLLLIIRIVVLFAPLRVFLPVSLFLIVAGLISSISGIILEDNLADRDVIILLSGIIIFFYGILADQLSAIRREMKQ